MPDLPTVRCEVDGPVTIVTIDRPAARNAVNPPTAARARRRLPPLRCRCLAACRDPDRRRGHVLRRLRSQADGGRPSRPSPRKRRRTDGTDAAHARQAGDRRGRRPCRRGRAGLALWCDLRVAARDATFGVYCRRFGMPLMDLGTIRLPRLIGQSRAMDMILTGRAVSGEEAERIGLANRLVEPARRLPNRSLGARTCTPPAGCPAQRSALGHRAMVPRLGSGHLNEFRLGIATVATGETEAGARRFAAGVGRHGKPV